MRTRASSTTALRRKPRVAAEKSASFFCCFSTYGNGTNNHPRVRRFEFCRLRQEGRAASGRFFGHRETVATIIRVCGDLRFCRLRRKGRRPQARYLRKQRNNHPRVRRFEFCRLRRKGRRPQAALDKGRTGKTRNSISRRLRDAARTLFLSLILRLPLCVTGLFPMIRWRLRGRMILAWQLSLGRFMQPV